MVSQTQRDQLPYPKLSISPTGLGMESHYPAVLDELCRPLREGCMFVFPNAARCVCSVTETYSVMWGLQVEAEYRV